MEDPTGYGRIIRDEAGKVQGIVEQKDATPEQLKVCEGNTGILAARASALGELLSGQQRPAGILFDRYFRDGRKAGHVD